MNKKILPKVVRSEMLCPFCGCHMQECSDPNAPTIYSCVNGPCPSEVGWAPYEEHLDAYDRYKHCEMGIAVRSDCLPFDCQFSCQFCRSYRSGGIND